MSLPPLKYTTLKHGDNFRLLILLPGQRGSSIKCLLEHVDLENPPPYEALSYTWGNPKSPDNVYPPSSNLDRIFSIEVGNSHANITYNLEAALQHLRSETQPRTLWVDALCIDQKNNDERAKQVNFMAKIYSRAIRVLCWLGESDACAEEAFNTLDELSWAATVCIWRYCADKTGLPLHDLTLDIVQATVDSALSPFKENQHNGLSAFQTTKKILPPTLKKVLSASNIKISSPDLAKLAISRFGEEPFVARSLVSGTRYVSDFSDFDMKIKAMRDTFHHRSYWSRLWIVQEFLLAKEAILICGGRHFDLDMMLLIWLVLNFGGAGTISSLSKNCDTLTTNEFLHGLAELSLIFGQRLDDEMPTLFETTFRYAEKVCSEPRDAIYALLGISLSSRISISYDNPVPCVFTEATRAIISQSQSIDLLCMTPWEQVLAPEFGGISLPSWVPHFEGPLTPLGLFSAILPDFYYTKTWPLGDTECIPPVNDMRVLRVEGCFYDTVTSTQPGIKSHLITWDMINKIFPDIAPSLRTLVIDRYPDNSGYNLRIVPSGEPWNNFKSDLKAFESNDPPQRLLDRMEEAMYGKTLCVTANRCLAHVSSNVEVGDHIFVARGSTIPLLIRPISNNETFNHTKETLGISTFYNFVGGGYVHGIMDGELREMIDGVTLKEETVYLI